MSDPSLSKFSIEEIRRLAAKARDNAKGAPKNVPEAPSNAWAHQSNEWGRYREELKRRGIDPDSND